MVSPGTVAAVYSPTPGLAMGNAALAYFLAGCRWANVLAALLYLPVRQRNEVFRACQAAFAGISLLCVQPAFQPGAFCYPLVPLPGQLLHSVAKLIGPGSLFHFALPFKPVSGLGSGFAGLCFCRPPFMPARIKENIGPLVQDLKTFSVVGIDSLLVPYSVGPSRTLLYKRKCNNLWTHFKIADG